jgi:uncharacterized protein (TIGR03790 family)
MRLGLLGMIVVQLGVLGALAQTPEVPLQRRVLVVYNASARQSQQVAQYYMRKRGIPAANLCRIRTAGESTVKWDDYPKVVRNPIRKCLDRLGRDTILYIVFAYSAPFRLSAVPPGYGIALDQYVADIWNQAGDTTRAPNPYYAEIQSRAAIYPAFVSLADYRRQPQARVIYSVWRLDAATPADARALVDKTLQAEKDGLSGQACIDRRYGPDMQQIKDENYGAGDWDLHRAAQFLRDVGVPVVEDPHDAEFGTPPAPARCDDAVFYAGWYSLNRYNDVFTWKPGALGFHLDSLSLANPGAGPNWGAGALRHGLTLTSGAVAEPYLPGMAHVDGIVHDLLAGANAGDALLRNTLWLRWMILNVGDPLYRPRFLPSESRPQSVAPPTLPLVIPTGTAGAAPHH